MASLGEFEVQEVLRLDFGLSTWGQLAFSPDSRRLVTLARTGALDLWDLPGRAHLQRLAAAPASTRNKIALFLPDGDLAYVDLGGGVSFLGPGGRPSTRARIEREDREVGMLDSDRRGRSLAVGWDDGQIDLFDVSTGALHRSWGDRDRKSLGSERWFALSPDGQQLALRDPRGRLWLQPTSGEDSSVLVERTFSLLAFSPDGAVIAGGASRSLVLWDVSTKSQLMSLGPHGGQITGCAFSPDGTMAATTCTDQLVRIWDARDGRPLTILNGPSSMEGLAFSPDGIYLATSAVSGVVSVYRFTGVRVQRRLTSHRQHVQRVVFHPRLPRLASGAGDNEVIVWDAESGRPLRRWGARTSWLRGLAYSPDGSLLAAASGTSTADGPGNSIQLWDAETGERRGRLERTSRWGIHALAFDSTVRRLASGDQAGEVLLWNLVTGKILREEKLGWPVNSIAFADRDRQLVVGFERGVARFDLVEPESTRRTELPGDCTRLVVDELAGRILAGDSTGGLYALALEDLSIVQSLADAHDGAIDSLALSRDGRLLATGGEDRRVVLHDPSTLESVLSFPAWTGSVADLAFDASGRWLAFAGAGSQVALWDLGRVDEGLVELGLARDRRESPLRPPSPTPAGELERSPVRITLPSPYDLNNDAWAVVDPDGARQGDRAHALELARRAVDLAPRTPEFRDTLAWALLANGLDEEALVESERALELVREASGDAQAFESNLNRIRELVEEARQTASESTPGEDERH